MSTYRGRNVFPSNIYPHVLQFFSYPSFLSSALSSAPLFLAKLPVGFLSGLLLQRYCPENLEEGEVRHSKTMWMIIGISTIVSPIMITLLWGYISGGGGTAKTNDSRINDGRKGDDIIQEDDTSEHTYQQHRLLKSNISLPRVRSSEERPLV